MKTLEKDQRVRLNNPGGHSDYQGTVTRVFLWGHEEWADVKWDMTGHPCSTPMQVKHLIPICPRVEDNEEEAQQPPSCARCGEPDKCRVMGRCLDQDERQKYFEKYGRWPEKSKI